MEGRELATLDKELLVQILEHMSYREVLEWCTTHPRFRELCDNDRTFYWNVIERKQREEGFAKIFVVEGGEDILIWVTLLQSGSEFELNVTRTQIQRILEIIQNEEDYLRPPGREGRLRTVNEVDLLFRFGRHVSLDEQHEVEITNNSGSMQIHLASSDFERIIRIALGIADLEITEDETFVEEFVNRDGYYVLLLDGSVVVRYGG